MASTSEQELTQMVRECVRNEIALQRSRNSTSLLMRTRDLIASSARSASREMTNSIAPDFPATGTPGQPGPSSSSSFQTGQSQYFQTGKKRPAATTNHPWRLKGKQKKQTKQEFHPKADPRKVSAILDMPAPENKSDLQRFLGMVTYLGKFVPNLSEVSAPLRVLLEKDIAWSFDTPQQQAFQELKLMITNTPVLKYFDPKLPIKVSSDASKSGLGATLEQKHSDCWYPVAFAS